MGLPFSLALRGRHAADARGAAAWQAAVAVLREADRVFSTYRTDSVVSRLGRGEITLADCSGDVAAQVAEVLALGAAAERDVRRRLRRPPRRGPRPVRGRQGLGRRARRGAPARPARHRLLPVRRRRRHLPHARPGRPAVADRDRGPARHRAARRVVPVHTGAVATSGTARRGAHIVDARTGLPSDRHRLGHGRRRLPRRGRRRRHRRLRARPRRRALAARPGTHRARRPRRRDDHGRRLGSVTMERELSADGSTNGLFAARSAKPEFLSTGLDHRARPHRGDGLAEPRTGRRGRSGRGGRSPGARSSRLRARSRARSWSTRTATRPRGRRGGVGHRLHSVMRPLLVRSPAAHRVSARPSVRAWWRAPRRRRSGLAACFPAAARWQP